MIQGLGAIQAGLSAVAGAQQAFSGDKTAGSAFETSFSEALAAAGGRSVGTLREAEALSLRALQGDVDTREVVDAVMSAEQTLQAAIAIRDKIVTAYLEISRMPI